MPVYLTVPEQAELLEVVSAQLGSMRSQLMRAMESLDLIAANADALNTISVSEANLTSMLLEWVADASDLLLGSLSQAQMALHESNARTAGVVWDKRNEINSMRAEIRKRRKAVVEQMNTLSLHYAVMFDDHIRPLIDKTRR